MSVPLVMAVGAVGGVGAEGRRLLDGTISGRAASAFPTGTLVVNVAGALVLGILAGVALSGDAYRVTGTGLIGAFTTFSTWMLESHRLGEDGQLRIGILNFAVSLVLGVAAAWAGRHLGSGLRTRIA